jgi:iron complex outermembrane receptor protein
MIPRCSLKVATWLAAASLLASHAVWAADAPSAQPAPAASPPSDKPPSPPSTSRSVGIEEIVVTAQKRSENIDDVPIAISAFNSDTLIDLGITDTRDMMRLVPGLNANESGRNTTLFTLRGVGFTDTTYTATNTVGTYIDEVNLPYSIMTRGANLDIERVEVLKGPQGTLYGRNTTGGLINYIAKAPTDHLDFGTNTSYGRFNTLESENFVSGPIFKTLNGRLAFKTVQEFDGWQISQTRPNDRLGQQDKWSARGSLDWRPTDSLVFHLRVEGWRDRSDPQAPQIVGIIPGNPFIGSAGLNPHIAAYPLIPQKGADPRIADWPDPHNPSENYGVFPGTLHDNFLMESMKTIWDLSDTMTLTAIGSHIRMESNGSPQLQGFDVTETDLVTNANIDTFAGEIRLSDRWFNKRFYWMIGVNASHDDAVEDELAFTKNAGALFANSQLVQGAGNPITDLVDLRGRPIIDQQAIFANTDTELTDTLSLNLGIRYTRNQEDFKFCASEPTNANQNQPTAIGLSNVFTGLSLLAATQYTATTGLPGRPSIVTKGHCFSLGVDGNNDPFVSKLDEDNVSGRAALSWKPTEEVLLYTSFSRGYKAGGFPVLNPARKAQLVPVTQEELRAYEIGSKLSFFDRRLHLNVTGFYYDYHDKQLLTKTLDQIFGPLPILQNAPRSHVKGLEVEMQTTPFDGFYLAFAGSYIKTHIDEFIGRNSEGTVENFAGKPFNYAPELQLSVLADYTRTITDRLNAGVGLDYYRTSDTNGTIDQNPLLAMNGYGLLGGRLHVGRRDGKLVGTLFARNITNALANVGTNSFSEAVTRAVARPLWYGGSISYVWD